jgi:exopolysaccharide biosynthesis polyprenyl glycosylphosphotransferase
MIHVKHLRRRNFFIFFDFICICLSIYLAIYIRTQIPLPFFTDLLPTSALQNISFVFSAFILSSSFCISGYLIGLYDLWNNPTFGLWSQKLIIPNVFAPTIFFTYLYLNKNFLFPSSYLVTFLAVNFFLTLAWRIFYFKIFDKEMSKVILIGEKEKCIKFAYEFKKDPFLHRVEVCAVFCPDKDVKEESDFIKKLKNFETDSKKLQYNAFIIVSSQSLSEETFSYIFKAAKRDVQVYTVPNYYEILLGKLKHIHVNDLPLFELKLETTKYSYLILKRTFDILASLFLIILLFLPICIIAIFIKISSKGSIIYRQKRVGKKGKVFLIFKLRSMLQNAEERTGAILATHNDPRITKFGKLMRKTRIDEIPQLINILKGDMSFVGPRPERPSFVDKFVQEIPAYAERARIRPGITGLAQIHGGYESSPETKLKYDLAYLVNQSLFLDLQILFKTLKVVLLRKGQ